MQLEKPEPANDAFHLVMSPVELKEVHALAKFAQAGIAYDAHAAYVAQVFVYIMLQPKQILENKDAQAAFAAVDRLAAENPANAAGDDLILRLPKVQMLQLLMMLGMAAESEDQADIVHDGVPEKFPCTFPDLQLPARHYAEAFDRLLDDLYKART